MHPPVVHLPYLLHLLSLLPSVSVCAALPYYNSQELCFCLYAFHSLLQAKSKCSSSWTFPSCDSSTTSFIHTLSFHSPILHFTCLLWSSIHVSFSLSALHPLTVVAIFAQVLLNLLRREAGVFGDAKIGQDVPWLFGVCILHPCWNGEASVQRDRKHRNLQVSLSGPTGALLKVQTIEAVFTHHFLEVWDWD